MRQTDIIGDADTELRWTNQKLVSFVRQTKSNSRDEFRENNHIPDHALSFRDFKLDNIGMNQKRRVVSNDGIFTSFILGEGIHAWLRKTTNTG
jgi:hypothetical protein